MTSSIDTSQISKITREDIIQANSRLDIDHLKDDKENKAIIVIAVVIIGVLAVFGLITEKKRKEAERKKRLLERKKKIDIHLDKKDVNQIWEKITTENQKHNG